MICLSWDFNFADKTKWCYSFPVLGVGAIPTNTGAETAPISVSDSVKHTFYGITHLIKALFSVTKGQAEISPWCQQPVVLGREVLQPASALRRAARRDSPSNRELRELLPPHDI